MSDNSFFANSQFETVRFGDSGMKGSFKQFALFNSAVSGQFLAQMRAGTIPSPYDDNSLVAYYYLDGTDISGNSEMVFNQVKGSWDALFLNIPSATKGYKFADPAVTTRQRYEELPSCRNEEGLYLDPGLQVCKTIEHYAFSVVGTSPAVLPLPERRDGGASWTLSFWTQINNEIGGALFIHKDSSSTMKMQMQYSADYEVILQDSILSAVITVPSGQFLRGKWNSVNLVCSEPSLENQCRLFPNFFTPADRSNYFTSLFLDSEISSLELPLTSGIHLFSRLRAWSSVIGGSLSSSATSLQEGAYSLSKVNSGSLRIFFPLTNGDVADSVTGNIVQGITDSQFSYYWAPTNFGGKVQEQISQCIIPSLQQNFTPFYATESPQGFTLRLWYRMSAQSGQTVLIENVDNFKIKKQDRGNYMVTQLISDPQFASYSFSIQSTLLTSSFWDMLVYKLDKRQHKVYGFSYNYGDIHYNFQTLANSINWNLNPPSTSFILSDSSSTICVREVSFRGYPVDFVNYSRYFTEQLSSSTKGMAFYLSSLTYQGSAISTDSSIQEISFTKTGTIMNLKVYRVLTIKPSYTLPTLTTPSASYSDFTLMILYKISSGAITSAVNLIIIPSSLSLSFQTNTQISFGSCSLTGSFSAGVDQGDWLPLAVVYNKNELRAYRFGEMQQTACTGQQLNLSGTIDLSQGASGVDISYANIYLFSECLTPGEVLFSSFRKLPLYFINQLLIIGYPFYERDPLLSTSIIQDISGVFSNDFTGVHGLQWDSTKHLNGGTAPALNAANAELQMCESDQSWSKGGCCFPSTRTLSISADPSQYFPLANTGAYSFVMWFKMETTLESTSLLKFNSGETELKIQAPSQTVEWIRSDSTMHLSLPVTLDIWIHVGGSYRSDGIHFFANANQNSLTSAAPVTGIDVALCESMSLTSARLRLFLLSIWNSKIPFSTLKQTASSRVAERQSAVLFLLFNFLYQAKYPNWIDPSTSMANIPSYESSTSDTPSFPMISTCELGTKSQGSQCSSLDQFVSFTGIQSTMTAPLDSQSLSIDPLRHSILTWFALSQQSSMTGSVDLKFGQECFHLSLSPAGSFSLIYGTSMILTSYSVSSFLVWHLLKVSIRSDTFDISMNLADGTQVLNINQLTGIPVPTSPSMTTFSLESSLSGGRIFLAYPALYPFAIPNIAALEFASLIYDASDPGRPSFLLPLKSAPYLQDSVSLFPLTLDQSAITPALYTDDTQGDSFLRCLFSSKSYDTANSACIDPYFISCSDANSLTCSASGFSLICQTNFFNSGGICYEECPQSTFLSGNSCFSPGVPLTYTITMHPDNSFTVALDNPLSQSDCNQWLILVNAIEQSFRIVLSSNDRSNFDYSDLSVAPNYDAGLVTSFDVTWNLKSTIRSKDQVTLTLEFAIQARSFAHPSAILNAQENPDIKAELDVLDTLSDNLGSVLGASAVASVSSVLITDGSLKYLWGLVNISQLMALVPLIDIPVPPNVMILFRFMAVANGDFAFMESLPNLFRERHLFNITILEQQKPLNSNFEFTGYESGSFFLLQQLKLVLLLFYLAFLIPIILLSLLLSFNSKCTSCKQRLVRFFNFDFWLRLILQIFLQVFLSVFIAFHSIFSNPSRYVVDVVLTILSFLLLLVFSLASIIYICTRRSSIIKRSKEWKGKVFTEQLFLNRQNRKNSLSLMYYPYFIIERVTFCAVLVIFRSQPSIAPSLCFILFLLVRNFYFQGAIYVASVRPFNSKLQVFLELFSKITMAILMIFIIYLHLDGNSISERALMNVGYCMIALILINFTVNLLSLIIISLIGLILFCKKKRTKSAKTKIIPEPELDTTQTEQQLQPSHKTNEIKSSDITLHHKEEPRVIPFDVSLHDASVLSLEPDHIMSDSDIRSARPYQYV